MEQYFWKYGVIRKNNSSMAHPIVQACSVDTNQISYEYGKLWEFEWSQTYILRPPLTVLGSGSLWPPM